MSYSFSCKKGSYQYESSIDRILSQRLLSSKAFVAQLSCIIQWKFRCCQLPSVVLPSSPTTAPHFYLCLWKENSIWKGCQRHLLHLTFTIYSAHVIPVVWNTLSKKIRVLQLAEGRVSSHTFSECAQVQSLTFCNRAKVTRIEGLPSPLGKFSGAIWKAEMYAIWSLNRILVYIFNTRTGHMCILCGTLASKNEFLKKDNWATYLCKRVDVLWFVWMPHKTSEF